MDSTKLFKPAVSFIACTALFASGFSIAAPAGPQEAALVQTAHAKTVKKAGYYFVTSFGNHGLSRAKLTKTKLTVWGPCAYSKKKSWFYPSRWKSSAKRVFKLAKNVKIGYWHDDSFVRGRAGMKSGINNNSIPALIIRVKGGKAVAIEGGS